MGTRHTPWLDLDPCYQGLGRNVKERARRYQEFIMSAIPDNEWPLLRQAVQRGQLKGTERFIEEVAARIGKRVVLRGQGRPKKRALPQK
jgi:putative transposase